MAWPFGTTQRFARPWPAAVPPRPPRHGGAHHRHLDGRRGLLDLSAPRVQRSRTVRHRRPGPRGRPRHPAEAGRRPGRRDHAPGPAAEPVGRPATRPSPTVRKPAKTPTTPSSAVPLLRGGRSIGVLVVQNRTERVYDEEEVEDLQIIAMVLAEMVSSGELLGAGRAQGRRARPAQARAAEGLALRRRPGLWRGGAARAAGGARDSCCPTTPCRGARLDYASSACRPRSTRCWKASTAWSALLRGAGHLPDVRPRPGLEPVAWRRPCARA
jgi:hypothetical protein